MTASGRLRVLYLTTTSPRAVPVLETLLDLGCDVLVYVPDDNLFSGRTVRYWQPGWMPVARRILRLLDRVRPRRREPGGKSLAGFCEERNISVHRVPGDARLDEAADRFATRAIDWVVVNNYPFLIGQRFIEQFPGRIVNFHSSFLPYYRGLNQSLRILANLEERGGVTLHFVARGSDTGNIVGRESFPLPRNADLAYYQACVAEGAARILRDAWPRLREGTTGTEQPDTEQSHVVIDEPTSRVLRWLNLQRRRLRLPIKRI